MPPAVSQHTWAKPEDWDRYKNVIHGLYCVADKPLKQVMQIMREKHGFHATWVPPLNQFDRDGLPPG